MRGNRKTNKLVNLLEKNDGRLRSIENVLQTPSCETLGETNEASVGLQLELQTENG